MYRNIYIYIKLSYMFENKCVPPSIIHVDLSSYLHLDHSEIRSAQKSREKTNGITFQHELRLIIIIIIICSVNIKHIISEYLKSYTIDHHLSRRERQILLLFHFIK